MSCAHITALSAGLWETAGVLLARGKKPHQKIEKLGHLDSFDASFQLGFCCCSDWHIWAHTDCAAAGFWGILHACCPCTQLVCTPGCLEGPGQGQGCVELALSSYQQQEAASASVRVPARCCRQRHGHMWGLHKLQQHGCQKEQPAVCPGVHSPPWTVLLTLFFFSYLFLHSFFSRQHKSLPSLGCFSSSLPNPPEKFARPFLGQVLVWWLCLNSV